MKTRNQIQNQIKAAFVANETLQAAYGLEPALTFDEQFSAVSIEATIIFVIAYTWHLVEQVMAAFRTEIDQRIESAYIASIPWYYDKCLNYQHGHDLVFNPTTYRFEYAQADEAARIVKFAAVRQEQDTVTKLKIYTNKAGKVPLTPTEHSAFVAYMHKVGAAGIHYQFINLNPDRLKISLQVIFNPLVLDSTGAKLDDGTFPVREAIQAHIDGISFGGMLNRTRLIDAIQAAEGVEDVVVTEIQQAAHGAAFVPSDGPYSPMDGLNIISDSGSFVIDTLTDTYTPNV